MQKNIMYVNNAIRAFMGGLADLTTTAKGTIVLAINELVTNQGTLSSLTTTVISSLVGAINELEPSRPRAITDPGNGGAIPVTKSGTCGITSTGSDTRTLAIPTFVGQILTLTCIVDGGSCVVTSAQAINQANNTLIAISDVNDTITLYAVTLAAGALRWRVLANDGAALS